MNDARINLRFARVCILLALIVTLGFRAFAVQEASTVPRATLELVQTIPTGTQLGLDGLREAHEVWPAMIDSALKRIDLAHFYASDREDGRLLATIEALERAAKRGVAIRFLAEKGFHETYPETLDRLNARDGIEMRLLDLRAITGGVLHAKLMLIDAKAGFVGSQNFDWRSLEHIQELGVRFESPALANAYGELFERDWAIAGGAAPPETWAAQGVFDFPIEAADGARVTPVMSPKGLLLRPELWDLPRLKALIDGAEETVRVQLLTYKATHGREPWDELDGALRAAAARGVDVQLLLSHWSTRASVMGHLKELTVLENIEVRILTVPEDPAGFEPFSRVAHSKLMTVDGERAWIGTSNWEGDYFYASRNVGLILEGGEISVTLDRYFSIGWESDHAEPVDPTREYPEPRVSR